jgi:hypothetical protein
MQVLLHPKGHVLQPDDVGLVICWDLQSAYAISKLGDKRMAQKNWKRKNNISAFELQKYRRGPFRINEHELQKVESSRNVEFMDGDNNHQSIESQMRFVICSRYEESSQGDNDALELGDLSLDLTNCVSDLAI